MQMRIGNVAIAGGIPGIKAEVDIFSMVRLFFRHGPSDNNQRVVAINHTMCLEEKTGDFRFGAFQTEWFPVNGNKHHWALNPWWLLGKKLRIEAKGMVAAGWGSVDIDITIIDQYNEGKPLISLDAVPVKSGWHFTKSEVTGLVIEAFHSLNRNKHSIL